MHQQRRFRIAASILVCFLLQAQGADKYTDENRPYEFGFNVEIDGSKQQHRHEKKDKDGIIMGEFGFVTADDVYHITVYATDKEGRFKILSMKNIHLKKSPSPAVGPIPSTRQGHSLALPASHVAPAAPAVQVITAPQAIPAAQPQMPIKQISLQPPGRSCSSCSLPTTTPRVPDAPPANFAPQNQQSFPPSANFAPQNQQAFPPSAPAFANNVRQGGFDEQPFGLPVNDPTGQNYPQHSGQSNPNFQSTPSKAQVPNAPNNYAQSEPFPPLGQNQPTVPSQTYPGQPPVDSNGPQQSGQQYSNGAPSVQSSYPQGGSPGRTSKQYTGLDQQFDSNLEPSGPQGPGSVQRAQPGPVKPTLVSAQMQIVDKTTDIHALRPGEKQGLPAGLTKNDMTQLLYTFNYTLGFHGHFEEGYTNGVKKGYYFVTGRNGVRTRIDYVADDTGFHPRVSQDVLDLLSEDVPKPETEKDEKYGLKGYEFKWLYYPADSKKR